MKRDEPSDVTGPSVMSRVGLAIGGLVVGRVAGRIARPMATRLATRYGMPAGTVIRIVNVATPLLFTLAVQTYVHRRSSQAHGRPARKTSGKKAAAFA
jgi:hypothetical protein